MLPTKTVFPFEPERGFENIPVINNLVHSTIYRMPITACNVSFWKVERALLSLVDLSPTVDDVDDNSYSKNKNGMANRTNAIIISTFFGLDSWEEGGTFTMNDNSNKLYIKMNKLQKFIGKEKIKGLYLSLTESIEDYYRPWRGTSRFLISFHKPGNQQDVIMNMCIRVHSDKKFEHRHIQQSVKYLISSYLNKEPLIPHLSMLMHVVAARFAKTKFPQLEMLIIEPLAAMWKILVKSGFAPPSSEIRTSYYVELEEKMLQKLILYDAVKSWKNSNTLSIQCSFCDSPAIKQTKNKSTYYCKDCAY
jgi:hypothetical protein